MRRGCRDIVSRMAETCQDSLLLATALPVDPNADPESLRSGLGMACFIFGGMTVGKDFEKDCEERRQRSPGSFAEITVVRDKRGPVRRYTQGIFSKRVSFLRARSKKA
jgi:hypothetical protein